VRSHQFIEAAIDRPFDVAAPPRLQQASVRRQCVVQRLTHGEPITRGIGDDQLLFLAPAGIALGG
jgi:hypothetical protein